MKTPNSAHGHFCGLCGQRKPTNELMVCDLVRPSITALLDASHTDWRRTGWVCRGHVQDFRRKAVEDLILRERGELTALDKEVIDSLADHETLTENTEESYDEAETFGDRVADRTASFAGSWVFILSFIAILVVWVAINVIPMFTYDPYPFILLNLFLSMIAALQAPLIMMSQRRQEEKDRLRSQNDYQVNLKAELEIRHLHEKLDHFLVGQWERLSKIQQAQFEMLEELSQRKA
ncbi:DUF1003 domain-containing protein [Ensifer sp. ENS09]|uniref:DUF1003 domain-containing protein n=1 Tax=Ensifer sp. ENS09 TaxID=2769263 RepID=UPI001AEE4842|nr:DUF1003 domain-containing protein [Ensifer sp. ENS09]